MKANPRKFKTIVQIDLEVINLLVEKVFHLESVKFD